MNEACIRLEFRARFTAAVNLMEFIPLGLQKVFKTIISNIYFANERSLKGEDCNVKFQYDQHDKIKLDIRAFRMLRRFST
jgi:hypothetical protein